jgi:hypothetical protein
MMTRISRERIRSLMRMKSGLIGLKCRYGMVGSEQGVKKMILQGKQGQ